MPLTRPLRRILPVMVLVIALVPGRRHPTPQDPTPTPSLARPTPHPFEGVYQLRRRVAAGIENLKPGSGFLAITHRHLFVSFAAPGADPDLPLLRSSTRTWTAKDDVLQMTVQMGWYTDADGDVRLEQPGTVEKRRLEMLRGLVRLCQDDRNYLEFERVE